MQPLRSTPVFVYGALRSGTTMFRLMLNSHDALSNPGEVDFLFTCLVRDPGHPTGWRYDRAKLEASRIFRAHDLDIDRGVDGLDMLRDMIAQFEARLPGGPTPPGRLTMNVHHKASRIVEVLPEARFIHMLRDPRDVARSSIGMGWAALSYYGIDHWIRTEREWDAAAAGLSPEQVLTLKFETLMADIGPELRRVCAFLEVPFSDKMLDYHLDTTYGPPDPRLSEQWRRKAGPREIALMEGKCGPLLEARGYRAHGAPVVPGLPEAAGLYLRNRAGRFRRTLDRIGLRLFVLEKASRFMGLRDWNARIRRRIDDRVISLLK